MKNILSGRVKFTGDFKDDAKKLIDELLQQNPKKRPDIKTILLSDWAKRVSKLGDPKFENIQMPIIKQRSLPPPQISDLAKNRPLIKNEAPLKKSEEKISAEKQANQIHNFLLEDSDSDSENPNVKQNEYVDQNAKNWVKLDEIKLESEIPLLPLPTIPENHETFGYEEEKKSTKIEEKEQKLEYEEIPREILYSYPTIAKIEENEKIDNLKIKGKVKVIRVKAQLDKKQI